ncbi:GDSL esterase/lipase At1g29670-like [Bidens hawaiensis]|uniref:GDSL esterase/lipase At1g29670-like n=1 Tax=Bidens hawaiensis TaxID=980011 RepID=UPI00404B562B
MSNIHEENELELDSPNNDLDENMHEGIEVAWEKDGLVLSQRKYVMDILEDIGMLGCKPSAFPMEQKFKLGIDNEEVPANVGKYRQLVGQLLHLQATRSDITYSANVLSQFGANFMMRFLFVYVIGEPQVPCYFIFGDSLVDNGNNNILVKSEKAYYLPYGIDFQKGATGRFTNGLTSVDIIGQLLGFPNFIPPYATATNEKISRGVNYGSGGGGIRPESGRNLGDRINLDMQLLNHATIVQRVSQLQRNKTFTNEYIKKCIYLVNIGSNDYVNNYLMPNSYPTGRMYTPDQYATILIRQYSKKLTTLYKLRARKVVVFGLTLIGCTPAEIAMFGTDGKPCVESINNVTDMFNKRLRPLVDDLNNGLSDSRFTFVNFSGIFATQEGLPNVPCCEVQSNALCIPNSIPCRDRASTAWYDGFHPSEIANRFLASRSYTALSPMDASPYDISTLAQL